MYFAILFTNHPNFIYLFYFSTRILEMQKENKKSPKGLVVPETGQRLASQGFSPASAQKSKSKLLLFTRTPWRIEPLVLVQSLKYYRNKIKTLWVFLLFLWCPRLDSNQHAEAYAPKAYVYTNFTTRA